MESSSIQYIIAFGFLMAAIAFSGSLTLLLKEETLNRILLPLVAFAAGSLIGGALFHMIPSAIEDMGNHLGVFSWLAFGFVVFFIMEQFLEWHHSHYPSDKRKAALTYLILLADGLHNFIGGLAIGAAFTMDIKLGLTAWLVAAAHELPQELGDFAVLVHGKWGKGQALLFNFFSGLTFLVGGVVAYFMSTQIDVSFLVPFAAGNFLYIGAADLIPEIKQGRNMQQRVAHLIAFLLGLGLLLCLHFFLQE
jgi:zinc and cadmium transporter